MKKRNVSHARLVLEHDKQLNLIKEYILSSHKEHKKWRWEIIMPWILSGITIIVTLISLYFTTQNHQREYDYKISPEVDFKVSIAIQKKQKGVGVSADNVHLEIKNKNNLQSAYWIYPGKEVKQLDLNKTENGLFKFLATGEKDKIDYFILDNGIKYYHKFLLLKNKNGTGNLILTYVKIKDELVEAKAISSMELYGLETSNPKDTVETSFVQEYKDIYKYYQQFIEMD